MSRRLRLEHESLSAIGILLACLSIALLLFGPGRAVAADSGVVEVYGYQWTKPVKIQLSSLQGTPETINGKQVDTYGMRDILVAADAKSSDLDLATLPEIEIVLYGSGGTVTYRGDQIRKNVQTLPRFYVNDQGVTVMRVPGKGVGGSTAEFPYDGTLNPQLYEPKQTVKQITVDITPKNQTVKSGSKLTLSARVGNLPKGSTPVYTWAVNGRTQSGASASLTHTFAGKAGTSFAVSLSVSATGASSGTAGTQVFIDKVKDKPRKKKKKDSESQDQPDDSNYDPGYVPGYTDGYGGGYGGGTGSSSNGSTPNPGGKKKKQDKQTQPPVDDGLDTVSGQLIDPGTTATVIPPSDSSDPGTEQASPAEEKDSGGFGISKGAATALGIGALLGLGGLAEAGAFAGFGRFRFRP